MAKIEVHLPQMGEGVIEATLTRWLTDLNNAVKEDEPLVEIATDKVDSEIPAPVTGILIKQFFSEGEIPKVGDIIAIIETKDASEAISEVVSEDVTIPENNIVEVDLPSVRPSIDSSIITPFIRHYASQRGISHDELKEMSGTGPNGLITKHDVTNYFKTEKSVNSIKDSSAQTFNKNVSKNDNLIKPIKKEYVPKEGEEVIEIGRTRKLIAEYMVKSLQTAPHVTSTVEVDLTHIVQWRERIKKDFKAEHGANLTYTPIIVEHVVRALKSFPDINVSLQNDYLIKKKYINIGIATALPDGNLIVPVVKNADQKNLTKLAIEIADLSNRARNNKLLPGETAGGTFTITNLGQFNNIMGTPIINQPESAILAVGAIKKRPWVIEQDGMHTIGIRDVLTLSLSYDHRIIDGALGGAFLNEIGQLLENSTPGL